MTARVYGIGHWFRARQRRAQAGRAPRLAVVRSIQLRQSWSGQWSVVIGERRFGKWLPPQILCSHRGFDQARAAALDAWRAHHLPLVWAYAGETKLRPFYEGASEPSGVAA